MRIILICLVVWLFFGLYFNFVWCWLSVFFYRLSGVFMSRYRRRMSRRGSRRLFRKTARPKRRNLVRAMRGGTRL